MFNFFLSLRVFELSLRPTPTFGSTTCVCVCNFKCQGKIGSVRGERGREACVRGGETHWERGRRTEKWREILCSPWTTVTSGHLSNHWWFRETCKCRLLTGLTAPLPFCFFLAWGIEDYLALKYFAVVMQAELLSSISNLFFPFAWTTTGTG